MSTVGVMLIRQSVPTDGSVSPSAAPPLSDRLGPQDVPRAARACEGQ